MKKTTRSGLNKEWDCVGVNDGVVLGESLVVGVGVLDSVQVVDGVRIKLPFEKGPGNAMYPVLFGTTRGWNWH